MSSSFEDSSGSVAQHSSLGDSIAPEPVDEVPRAALASFRDLPCQGEEENASVAAEAEDDDAKDLVGEMNKYLRLGAGASGKGSSSPRSLVGPSRARCGVKECLRPDLRQDAATGGCAARGV